jgi:hypothetical protein
MKTTTISTSEGTDKLPRTDELNGSLTTYTKFWA